MKLIGALLLALLAFYLLAAAWLYVAQSRLIYYPTPALPHPYPTLVLEQDGLKIQVIVLNPGQQQAVLYFGGNGEASSLNAEPFLRHFPNHTLYLMNYRGYGGSEGDPGEAALYADALALYDRIAPQHTAISVIGRSLGSGVATQVAAQRPLHRLLLITPFDSMVALAQQHYPWFPVGWLLRERYDSIGRVPQIGAPTLIVTAQHDLIVPRARSDALIAAFPPNQLSTTEITGAGHNGLSLSPRYYAVMRQFLERPAS